MAEKKFDHEKFQSIASVIQIGQNVQMNSNIKKLGSGMERGLDQMRSQNKAQTKTLNELTKVGKEQIDVGKEHLAIGKEHLAIGKEHLDVGKESLEVQKRKEDFEQVDKDIKDLTFDIKKVIESLKENDEPVEVLLTVGNLSENMANNNINTHSVSDLDYKEIIANIEKDIKSLKEQSIAKLSQQDQEDLDILYDIVAENEEEKIIEIEQKITEYEMKISEDINKVELLENEYEKNLNTLNNLKEKINPSGKIDKKNRFKIDEVMKREPSEILACDPKLKIINKINNDVLFNLGAKFIGEDDDYYLDKAQNKHVEYFPEWFPENPMGNTGIFQPLGLFYMLFHWIVLYWFECFFCLYKNYKIRKHNRRLKNMDDSERWSLKWYHFSRAEKKELKRRIISWHKNNILDAKDNVEKLEVEMPLMLEQIEKGKKEFEGFVIKENGKISGFKQKVSELKERIKVEISNAGELLKRRPYLDSFLQGRT
jgi:hypothetical protein